MVTAERASAVVDPWRLGEASAVLMKMIGFEPTGEEQAAILRCRKRFKLVVGGGQAGKSLEASADFILHLFEDMFKNPGVPLLYWLVAADYDRTKAEFGYIERFLRMVQPGAIVEASKRVDPGYIEVRFQKEKQYRIRVETKSGKDPRTLAMFAPHGIIGCEASQLDLDTYYKCQERLAGRSGWLHLSGTYESSLGWYPGLAAAWRHGSQEEQSFILPSTTNKHFYPGGEQDPKILKLKKETSDEFFFERIMGIAAPPRGIVFGSFKPHIHIRECHYDPDLPVHISEDPGFAHAHAVEMWQVHKGQIHVFDEIFERGVIPEDIVDIAMKREWWRNPNKIFTSDPYYGAHQGGKSGADVWLTKTGLVSRSEKVKVEEGVERLKSFLKVDPITGMPGIIIDPKCKGIGSELGAWPNPFDNQTRVYSYRLDSEGNIIGDAPEQKWNDGISALIYGIVDHFGLVNTGSNESFIMRRHGSDPTPSERRKRRWFKRRF